MEERICNRCKVNVAEENVKSCTSCKRKVAESNRRWYLKQPVEYHRERAKKHRSTDKYKASRSRYVKNKRPELRQAIIQKYGGKCNCCGELEIRFLTFDHINDDGNKDKHRNNSMGFLRRLNNSPVDPTIQVLCWNCNCGRALNRGICPHESRQNEIS